MAAPSLRFSPPWPRSPNAAYEAVQSLPDIAGVASAVLLTAQMLLGATGGTLGAIGIVMTTGAVAAAMLYALWLRPRVEA
jgi:hypothetical protein